MFCLIKCSKKKVLLSVAALLCCGGILAAVQQTKAVSGSAYEDLYPDMYVNTGNEFGKLFIIHLTTAPPKIPLLFWIH